MSTIHTQHTYRVDLDRCPLEAVLERPLSHTDALADTLVIAVRRGLTPISLSGMSAQAYLTYSNRQTLPIPGEIAGSSVVITLPAEAYTIPGPVLMTVQLASGDARHTLLHLKGEMARTSAETLIPADALPTLPDLLAEIDTMRQSTADCSAAAAAANEAAGRITAAMASAAPAILCEASGPVASMTDASDRPARALVTTITAVQQGEGTPSPDNVRPINGLIAANLWHGAAYDAAASPGLTAALPEAVYGGTLDWTTGVLTVTHRMIQLTGSSAEDWKKNGSGHYYARRFIESSPGKTSLDGCCTHYRYANAYACIARSMQGRDTHVWLMDADVPSVDDLRAHLAAQAAAGTPVTLVYPLLTPCTVQLPPQQLTLLKGSNALWSDTGDTAVTYIADTKLYIDNRLAAIAASIINA